MNDINRKATKQSRSLQWDEETIAEHDKLRGTRQKIDEPPTPYSYHHYDNDIDNSSSIPIYNDSPPHSSGSPAYHSDSSDSNMKISMNNTPPLASSQAGLQPSDSLMHNWENLQVTSSPSSSSSSSSSLLSPSPLKTLIIIK